MSHRFSCAVLALAMIVAGAATRADAQGLTAHLSGVVTDTGGGVMPGATVTIKNVGTNLVKETVTGADGAFVFPDLLAGTFDLTVNVQGFKSYEQKGIVIGATDRVALRAITLEVGALEETVSVVSEATLVQTNNGARSALITRENLEDIALKGRDFAGMLKVLPGVIDTSAREAPGWGSMQNLSINGRGSFNFSYDGVTNKDTGSNSGNYAAPALDSIAEVRVQASNFQAEYGRSSGATISVITRSGTKDFHGTRGVLQARRRVERQRVLAPTAVRARASPRSATRRSTRSTTRRGRWAVQCSSPAPSSTRAGTSCSSSGRRTFCRARTRARLNQRRMPTALERTGDFSQTFDGLPEPDDLHSRPATVRNVQQRHRRAGVLSRATRFRPTASIPQLRPC